MSGPSGPSDGYVSTNSSTANSTTYTFTSQNIGTAASDRLIVVGIAGRDTASGPPSSVTVGGTGLTLDIDETNTCIASIWSGVITSGSAANIVITYAVANTYCGIGVWALYNKSLVATAEMTSNSTNPVANLTTVAGDFCIASLSYRANSLGASFTWNAATERYDGPADGAVRQFSGADQIATGTTTDMGGTNTNPFSTTESCLVAAAYR